MKYFFPLLILILAFFSCSKKTENFSQTTAKDLFPMAVGKVFIYRLDSISLNLGIFSTTYYLEKDSITSTFIDNQGRIGFVFFRYITDTLQSLPYHYADTHYAVVDDKRVEVIDNFNRRFIPVANPISLNTSWLGNSYLDYSQLPITPNTSYDGWNYQYTQIDNSFTTLTSTYPHCYTILQKGDSSGIFNPSTINSKTYSVEVYSKNIGLVYKEFLNYFYQITPSPGYEDGSYGIKMNLIDYK